MESAHISHLNWVEYDWMKIETRPHKSGKYLVYRAKCEKMHFRQWNGSGWSSDNNTITHWTLPAPPKKTSILKMLGELLKRKK